LLARSLDRHQHDVTVVMPDHLEGEFSASAETGVLVQPLPMRKIVWPPSTIGTVVRLIRQQKIDIIHVHGQAAGLIARVVVRLAGPRIILYTPHTIDMQRARWHWLYILLERILVRGTDTIISVNESDRNRLVQWGIPSEKVVTVPNGIDLTDFDGYLDATEARKSLGLDPERPLVMQVGRLNPQKDPLAFVEGAAIVVQECPNAQFVLVGDGPLRDEVATRIRQLDLDKQVRLAGWHDRAFRLMAAADVVSLTSRWEGTPYALLEAMACSRPVVATAVNGCLEVVAEGVTGFLVQPGDAPTWAKAVLQLLADPSTAAEMGRKGRQCVEERFTLQNRIGQIERLYQQLAFGSPSDAKHPS
jgi:glycosyltransferase involved in cell wall biosynthesis